jgi:peptidyl-prolyl cis-trans isomerase C
MKRLSPAVLALLASAASALAQDQTTAPATTAPATTAPATTEAPAAPPATLYDASTVLATVNGTEITLGLLHHVFLQLPPQYQQLPGDTLTPALLEQIVNQILLAQAGEKEGLAEKVGTKLAIENGRRDELAGAYVRSFLTTAVTEEAMKKSYDEKVAAMAPQQEAHAAHILVETEELAKEIIAKLKAGEDFAALAKANSKDPGSADGGDLGWFVKGQMVPEFETAVFAMAAGAVTETPVRTQFGFHVIKVLEFREKAKPTFEEMREAIGGEMTEAAIKGRIEALRAEAKIDRPATGVTNDALKDPTLFQ